MQVDQIRWRMHMRFASMRTRLSWSRREPQAYAFPLSHVHFWVIGYATLAISIGPGGLLPTRSTQPPANFADPISARHCSGWQAGFFLIASEHPYPRVRASGARADGPTTARRVAIG
jgi:hypothetical protein